MIDVSGGSERAPVGVCLRCCRCGKDLLLFDQREHGYDGELGHLAFLKGAERDAPLMIRASDYVSNVEVLAEFVFNPPAEELEVTSAEEGVALQDLFDWFNVLARLGGDHEWSEAWSCECA